MTHADFSTLKGLTIIEFVTNQDEDRISITTQCGRKFEMFHEHDCCEDVSIEDICGDVVDIIGKPILLAEESCNNDNPKKDESHTWTFYKLATIKGAITIRWYGSSNGYYSEGVSFFELQP